MVFSASDECCIAIELIRGICLFLHRKFAKQCIQIHAAQEPVRVKLQFGGKTNWLQEY